MEKSKVKYPFFFFSTNEKKKERKKRKSDGESLFRRPQLKERIFTKSELCLNKTKIKTAETSVKGTDRGEGGEALERDLVEDENDDVLGEIGQVERLIIGHSHDTTKSS